MLLINPASEQFGGMFSRYVPVGIPVATGTLAAYMVKYGHQVRVADEELEKLDENNIDDFVKGLERPYVFGISILTTQAARTYYLIQMLKHKWPDCYIVVGGIHSTALPDEPLRNGADFVVRGEGEVTLLKLYETIRSGSQEYEKIDGLSFKRDGLIHHTCEAKLIDNIDEIPIFPYELFENPRYDMGFITSSRGCPYKCSYCSQRLMTGLTYRFKSPGRIVEELDILISKYKQNHIVFYDDNFSFKKKRVIDVCEAIVKSGLHKKAGFFIQTRADNLYDDIMPYLKEANFTGVGFGMETAVERLAQVIVKNETVETHKKAIGLARKWGIDVSVFMIFGLPTETRQDRMESFKFVKDWGFRFTKFNNLIPYPGTKSYREIQHTPNIVTQPFWGNFNSTLSATRSIFDKTPLPYVPVGTSAWQLKRDIVRCNYSFYLQPKSILDILMRRGGPGFVMLPKNWYFKPHEIYVMLKLGAITVTNLFVSLLPDRVGGWIYLLLTGRKEDLVPREAQAKVSELPVAIDGTMRKIMIGRVKGALDTLTPSAEPSTA